MLAPVNTETPIRSVSRKAPAESREICLGAPSCDPRIQHELLKAVRDQIPHAYARAGRELGLNLTRTQELIERRVQIVSAASAIKLARMIAYEPNAREVLGLTGRNLHDLLNRHFPIMLKATLKGLPRQLRIRLALTWTRQIAHVFAGSLNEIGFEQGRKGIAFSVCNGVFSDRLDTLSCASAYYKNVFETLFQQIAFLDCEVKEVRRSRVHLNHCSFEIAWEA